MFLSPDSGDNCISLPRKYMEHWKIHEKASKFFKKELTFRVINDILSYMIITLTRRI